MQYLCICKCVPLGLPHIQGVRSQSAKLSQFSLEKLSSGQNWAVHSECLSCLSLCLCQPLLSSARLKQNSTSRVPFHQSFIESQLHRKPAGDMKSRRAAFALVSCGTLLFIITIFLRLCAPIHPKSLQPPSWLVVSLSRVISSPKGQRRSL